MENKEIKTEKTVKFAGPGGHIAQCNGFVYRLNSDMTPDLQSLESDGIIENINFDNAKAEGIVPLLVNEFFENCSFRRADFRRDSGVFPELQSSIEDCSFKDCDLSGANFENCDLSGTTFENCDLNGTNFKGAITFSTTFKKCKDLVLKGVCSHRHPSGVIVRGNTFLIPEKITGYRSLPILSQSDMREKIAEELWNPAQELLDWMSDVENLTVDRDK